MISEKNGPLLEENIMGINSLEIWRENVTKRGEQNKTSNYEPPKIIITIGDQSYPCILDTGSSVNVMS